jgi:transcriptional regulator with XRE-family HTH domain
LNLGDRIRDLRREKKLSGAELAQRSGVSRSLITQIEKNTSNPSIETLRRMANSLEVPIAAFFEEQEPTNGIVVRKNQRKQLKLPHSSVTYELLTPDLNRRLELLWIELEPGQRSFEMPMFGHLGEESAVVITGQVQVRINDDIFVLHEGDTISFDSSQPHSVANIGSIKAVMVSAITPPFF